MFYIMFRQIAVTSFIYREFCTSWTLFLCGFIDENNFNIRLFCLFQPGFDDMSPEYPEINYFDVELMKDNQQGLGITIAGYVGRDNSNPGRLW